MRRSNSNSSDKLSKNYKTPYLDIIAVGVIQFLLSLPILCYGVFLMQLVIKDGYNVKTGLWTAVTFSSASKITSPWTQSFCKHLDNIGDKPHKRNIIIATILLFSGLTLSSFINTPTIQIVFYGFFGGLLSSVIYIQSKFAESFKSQPKLFNMMDQIIRPFCLIIMPHLVLFLTNLYGTPRCQLILGGLILNIIPATLVVRSKPREKFQLCRFQTIDRLSIELADLSPKPIVTEPSSSSDEDEEEESESNKEEAGSCQPAINVQTYFQNVGVKILPNIPEESETEEEDDINEISSKRLSKISAILQELNESTRKSVNLSINNLYQPDEPVENVSEKTKEVPKIVAQSTSKRSRCFSVSSSILYEIKLKRRRIKSFLYERFVKSIPRTLSTFSFYPAVVSSTITTLLSTIILATAPYMMWIKSYHRNYPITPEEVTFILTVIGFSWLFFLAGYPVFSKLSSLKIKMLFLIGLSISGLSLFIAHKFSYDNFTLFSLTFGLGHGIVTYTENMACEDFLGKKNWKALQGALEICTGHIVILVYLIIYFSNLEIHVLLLYSYWIYVFNVLLWIVAYVLKEFVLHIRSVKRYDQETYPDFNY